MTLQEFGALLQTTGLDVAYESFPDDECPEMPFITFQEVGTNNVSADGGVYKKVRRMQVDLFTKAKSEATEALLETALNNFFWNSVQSYDATELCHRQTYEVEIL